MAMNIQISGAALSALFYEHSTNDNDLEGFLLGEITNKCTDTISDTQIKNVKEETSCNVYSYVVCRKPMMWYNNVGAVDPDKLKAILPGGKQKEVIGWYKFRRNSTPMASLREHAIHNHLLDCFPGILPANFVYLMCTPNQSLNFATHTMDHVFQVLLGSSFQTLPVQVTNLGSSVSQYKTHATSTVNCKAGQFVKIINQHKVDFGKRREVLAVQNMNRSLHKQFQSLASTVGESEMELDQLRQDIKRLKLQLKPNNQITDANQKQPAVKKDSNPFRDSNQGDGPSTSRKLGPTNPFYSSLPSFKPSTDPDPPPPYPEEFGITHAFTGHYDPSGTGGAHYDVNVNNSSAYPQEKNPFISTADSLAPPEMDLICFGDSDEENISNKNTVSIPQQETEQPSSSLDTMDMEHSQPLITNLNPDLTATPKVDWDKTNNSKMVDKFDFVDDMMKNSVKPMKPNSSVGSPRVSRTTRSNPTRKATSVKRTMEAIEVSSDEDDTALSGSPEMSGSPVF